MMDKLPCFNLDLSTFAERLEQVLKNNLQEIEALLDQKIFNWNNLMQPLEEMDDQIERLWSPLSHLHAVTNSKALRAVYQACLPQLSTYETSIGHNHDLYEAIKSIDRSPLDATQQKIIEDSLLHFTLAGVALGPEKKQRFEAIQLRLAELSNQFSNHLLDAVAAFSLSISDVSRLQGLPVHAIETAKQLAIEKGVEGWVLNLEFPCYLAVSTYCDDRDLRETMYKAYVTRASDEGPHAGQFDNTEIMNELLALRHEMAELLNFNNFAELSLATKMAESTRQVTDFLLDLVHRGSSLAREEYNQLKQFVQEKYQLDDLQPWDMAYYSEKLRQASYAISQEELRVYFPQSKVLAGLFTIINRLYGMELIAYPDAETWHPDVVCYQVNDGTGLRRGYLYIDLFARPHKQGGAWMDSLQTRCLLKDGAVQLPIATLTCNFAKTEGDACLSHEEVLTLFHEFGHCLHHILTQVNYSSVSGTHGVEWDAVELPSQIFENWCWELEALQLISGHIETGEVLPVALYQKLLAAKNFQTALIMMRQLEFSLFDFRIHGEYKNEPNFIMRILNQVRKETSIIPQVPYNRFQNSFAHIFAGGYCAGYYSYKWAEVLSSDAYSRFEEEGIFNPRTGRDFLRTILEVGGSKKAAEAFIDFRGRPPSIEALLRHNGLQTS